MSTWNRWCMPTNLKTAAMWTFRTWFSLGIQRNSYSTQTSQRNNHIVTVFLVVILILSRISEGMCGYFQEGLTEWQKTLPYSGQILLTGLREEQLPASTPLTSCWIPSCCYCYCHSSLTSELSVFILSIQIKNQCLFWNAPDSQHWIQTAEAFSLMDWVVTGVLNFSFM